MRVRLSANRNGTTRIKAATLFKAPRDSPFDATWSSDQLATNSRSHRYAFSQTAEELSQYGEVYISFADEMVDPSEENSLIPILPPP